jgi:hypothetical protein
MPHRSPPGPRHLHAVPDRLADLHEIPASVPDNPAPAPARLALGAWHRMTVEEARELVDALTEPDTVELTPARLAFNFGRLHGAAANLLDIIDAVTDTSGAFE